VLQRRVSRVTVDAIVGISCSQLDEREREGEEKRRERRRRRGLLLLL
jgi:hypothetical protein